MVTVCHAKFGAHELTNRRPSDSIEKLSSTLVDTQIGLNSHQNEAAVCAFRSPLSILKITTVTLKGTIWKRS
jgi:hypothetical protein